MKTTPYDPKDFGKAEHTHSTSLLMSFIHQFTGRKTERVISLSSQALNDLDWELTMAKI